MSFRAPRATVASAARTTTGNSGPIAIDQVGGTLHLVAAVTAQSGTTPTMVISIEWSHDGVTFAPQDGTADSFTSIGAATPALSRSFPLRAPYYRVVWTLAGTSPSYTFSVSEYITH